MPSLFPIEVEQGRMSWVPDLLVQGRQPVAMEWPGPDLQEEVESQRHPLEPKLGSLELASGLGWVLALPVVPFLHPLSWHQTRGPAFLWILPTLD